MSYMVFMAQHVLEGPRPVPPSDRSASAHRERRARPIMCYAAVLMRLQIDAVAFRAPDLHLQFLLN